MSVFDPNAFLDMPVEGTNDTVVVPCPVGEYLAVVEKVDVRAWTKRDDPSVGGLALDIIWTIEDQSVKEYLAREKVSVKQGIMLDLTDGGTLDMGKGRNISLGRLREAVGLNNPGQAFSFNQLPGQMAKVKVDHRPDKNDPTIIFAEIKAVTKAS